MTTRKIIEDFRDVVADKMQTPDSSGWSRRLIYQHMLNARAQLLWRKVKDSRQKLSQHVIQTIPCIPLERVEGTECPCEPKNDCLFMRTVHPIPHPIGPLMAVTSPDVQGMIHYSYVDWDKFKYKLNSRYATFKTKQYYTLKGHGDETYLYLYNSAFKKHVTISGVFEEPLKISQYPDCEGHVPACFSPLEQEFLLDADLVSAMYAIVFQMLTTVKASVKTDINQDFIDDQKIQGTK